MPARAIESKLTAMGKDERAISVSGYVHREMVKYDDVEHSPGADGARPFYYAAVLGLRPQVNLRRGKNNVQFRRPEGRRIKVFLTC
jgi:hypothetical protein